MKLNTNGRKIQRAIQHAVMLGLPVAGLLATVGCERKAALEAKLVSPREDVGRTMGVIRVDGPMGQVAWPRKTVSEENPEIIGGNFTEQRKEAFGDVDAK